MPLPLIAVLALVLACTSAAAATCETLRHEIEGKLERAGVADFSVTTVAAGASAPGMVVGTCDQGSRKIMYQRLTGAGGGSRPAPEPGKRPVLAKRGAEGILTECKDGSVVRGGDCKK